jgi:hypothetical protein
MFGTQRQVELDEADSEVMLYPHDPRQTVKTTTAP